MRDSTHYTYQPTGLITFHNFNVQEPLASTEGAMIASLPDDGVPTDLGMHLLFYTKPSTSSGGPIERMRITSTGQIGIGIGTT